jgi:nicotinamidase-related amidase
MEGIMMELLKPRNIWIVFIIALSLALSITIGPTVSVSQLAQAADKPVEKEAPAKCPEAEAVTINLPESALLMLHWENALVKPGGKSYKAYGKRVEEDNTISHAKAVLQAAREKGMFVIFVRIGFRPGYPELGLKKNLSGRNLVIVERKEYQQGSWDTDIIDELKPIENEPVIWNYSPDGFQATALDHILRNNEIKSLFISGIATNFVVETTMRAAHARGYKSYILMDCCNSSTKEAHCWPLANIVRALAVVTDSAHFINAIKEIK